METIVQTAKGKLEGVDFGSYVVFRGVPYAKPPVGELRWKAPQEMDAWEGIREAKEFGKIAVQDMPDPEAPWGRGYAKEFYSDPEFLREMSEDCLYLNVWAPKDAEGKKLPVAFWIHGGGFSGGYNSEVEFDGEAYCNKGVILVSVEYRCNVFGFFAHPWLDAENEKGISGNYGILDQIAALQWVRENIGAFGGDADHITVFGQSAGSMSTQVLVSSPLAKDLVSKAIFQSGISCEEEILATPTLAEEEKYGEMIVELTGAKSLQELRALTAEQLMEANRQFTMKMMQTGEGLMLVPNVDGYVLEKTVKQIWKEGEMPKIPYMAGTVNSDLASRPEDVEAKKPGILEEECKRWSLKCEETQQNPAYVYFFSHELPGDQWGAEAFHSSELWYMFGTLERCWRPMEEADHRLSEEMVSYWTNFMKTGDPNGNGLAEWKPCTKAEPYVKQF